jgi:hypothetical protein
METESRALGWLDRHAEALVLQQYCMKARRYHPERFPVGGKVPATAFFALAQSLTGLDRLDETEILLKMALAVLETDGIEFHPSMVLAMDALARVYGKQGRKK